MATNPHTSAAVRKAMLDSIVSAASSGILRVYSGTQPADADATVGAAVVLAELTLSATAFTSPAATASAAYTITANPVTTDASANATGTATWWRLFRSDGTSPIMDGTIGVGAGFDLPINSTAIQINASVSDTNLTLTLNP